MRKLASFRTIKELRPIPDADVIECAVVDGWTVVTKKGEFQVGDVCVFFEVDSVLPLRPEYEFLRKCCYVHRDWIEGFRLRTSKFRKQLSQGLALPVALFQDVIPEGTPLDADLTAILDIQKWDPPLPACLTGQLKGNFPSYIPKTDQERCQNLTDVIFSDSSTSEYEVSVKLDGTSCTVYHYRGEPGVCGRNYEFKLDDPGNTLVTTTKAIGLWEALAQLGRNLALQGELMGPGIQGNREKLARPQFFLYDAWDIDAGRYLTPDERSDLVVALSARMPTEVLAHCPVLHTHTTLAALGLTDLDALLAFAEGPSLRAATREGLVFKRRDGSFSFKVISNAFLLKGND